MSVDALRIKRLFHKELRQIFRDARLKRMVFAAPVIQLMVFGYAVNTDIRDTAMFVVDHDRTADSRALVDALTASGYFRVAGRSDRPADLMRALDRGHAIVGLEIPADYAEDLRAGRGAEVQLLVDGTNSNTATVAQGNAGRIARQHAERLAAASGVRAPAGVDLRIRAWFNPDLASRVYNVPGVLGVVLMLMCLLLTSMSVVRERELGTLEQLLVTPLSPAELIIGKTLPVVFIALVDLILITAVAIFWFDVPFRGSALALLIAALIYILAGLSFGLLFSTIARTQQEALMVMFLFFFPAMIISGFMFPIFTMPPVFQWLTLINPLRHFLDVVRDIFLKGAGLAELWPQYLALTALAVAGLAAARVRLARTGL